MFKRENLPAEASIFAVFVGIAILFEVLGWVFVGKSFLGNIQRLEIIILQVSIFGIIAVGVTQVIITSGIDLSGGAVLALSAMVAASFAQSVDAFAPIFPQFLGLPIIIPIAIGLAVGASCGWINGSITAYTGIPPFIATLGMLVTARAVAVIYTEGQPVYSLSESFTVIGSGAWPVLVFFVVAMIFQFFFENCLTNSSPRFLFDPVIRTVGSSFSKAYKLLLGNQLQIIRIRSIEDVNLFWFFMMSYWRKTLRFTTLWCRQFYIVIESFFTINAVRSHPCNLFPIFRFKNLFF